MKFSTALLEKFAFLILARSPDEIVEYYKNRMLAKPPANFSMDYQNIDIPTLEKPYALQKYPEVVKKIENIIKYIVETLKREGALKYIEWVIYHTPDKIYPEDIDQVVGELKIYDQLKKAPSVDLPKDINNFSSFLDLQQALDPYREKVKDELLKIKPEYQEKHLETGGIQIVIRNEPYEVIKMTDQDAATDLCRHTGWCVKDPKYFDYYNIDENNPLYLITKNGVKYALVHFETGQVKDAQDRPIRSVEGMSEELKPILQQIIAYHGLGDLDFHKLEDETGLEGGIHIYAFPLKDIGTDTELSAEILTGGDFINNFILRITSDFYDPEGSSSYVKLAMEIPELQDEIQEFIAYMQRIRKIYHNVGAETREIFSSLGGVKRVEEMLPTLSGKEKSVLEKWLFAETRKKGYTDEEVLNAMHVMAYPGSHPELKKFEEKVRSVLSQNPKVQELLREYEE